MLGTGVKRGLFEQFISFSILSTPSASEKQKHKRIGKRIKDCACKECLWMG